MILNAFTNQRKLVRCSKHTLNNSASKQIFKLMSPELEEIGERKGGELKIILAELQFIQYQINFNIVGG